MSLETPRLDHDSVEAMMNHWIMDIGMIPTSNCCPIQISGSRIALTVVRLVLHPVVK